MLSAVSIQVSGRCSNNLLMAESSCEVVGCRTGSAAFIEWIKPYTGWLAAVSIVTFVGTLVLIPILVVRMPADYFVRPRRESTFAKSHPVRAKRVSGT